MKFTHGVTPKEIAGNDADIYMDDGIASTDLIPRCPVFIPDGRLWIEPLPFSSPKKYAMPIPVNAVISRNLVDPKYGHFAILFTPGTPQWQTAVSIIEAIKNSTEKSGTIEV